MTDGPTRFDFERDSDTPPVVPGGMRGFYSDEDGGYVADIPDLDAWSAFGKTSEEALAEVTKARDAWLEAAKAAGKPIPQPRYRPVIYQAR